MASWPVATLDRQPRDLRDLPLAIAITEATAYTPGTFMGFNAVF